MSAAGQPTPTGRRFRLLPLLPPAGLVVAVAAGSAQLAPRGQEPTVTALVAAILAAITAVTLATYRLLVQRVGTATAWAGLVVLWALVVGGLFAISPDCYTGVVAERCSPREVASWTVVGALLPLLGLVAIFLPYRAARAAGRLVAYGYRRTRQSAPVDTDGAPANDDPADVTPANASRSGNPAVRATAKKG